MLDGVDIVYVERCRSSRAGQREIDLNLHVGSRMPAYCTSMGKVLLAFLEPDVREALLERSTLAPPRAEHARRRAGRCVPSSTACASEGFAINNEELAYGLRSIAAPVRGHDGDRLRRRQSRRAQLDGLDAGARHPSRRASPPHRSLDLGASRLSRDPRLTRPGTTPFRRSVRRRRASARARARRAAIARSTSTQRIPRASASVTAWGLNCWAARMPEQACLRRVEPDALEVAGKLLDRVDRADPLDLDGNPVAARVAAHQIDRADVGRPFAAVEAQPLAERLRAALRGPPGGRARRRPSPARRPHPSRARRRKAPRAAGSRAGLRCGRRACARSARRRRPRPPSAGSSS